MQPTFHRKGISLMVWGLAASAVSRPEGCERRLAASYLTTKSSPVRDFATMAEVAMDSAEDRGRTERT